MKIEVNARDMYGQTKFYPKCDNAKAFASIAGTTTLTHAVLLKVIQLGFKVDIHRQHANIPEELT